MFKIKTIVGLAVAGAFVASGASAHESYGHSHYSSTTAPVTYGTTYNAPTVNLGPIEYVQPSSTVQYVQPTTSYIQPATTTTYSAPVSTYSAPSYTTPSYAAQNYYTTPTYTTPTYTTPTYTAPSYGTTYTAPSYTTPTYTTPTWTTPSYVAPSYYAPRYDATALIERRIDRQRSRIRSAADRGELRDRERSKLRNKMRDIRAQFRSYKANDGIIDRSEEAVLRDKLSRQSDRIRRLANNHRHRKLNAPGGPRAFQAGGVYCVLRKTALVETRFLVPFCMFFTFNRLAEHYR